MEQESIEATKQLIDIINYFKNNNYSKDDFEIPQKPLGVELDCKQYKKPAEQQNGGTDFGI